MIKIIIGLVCVMGANIFLGSSLATLKKEWNKEKFVNGIFKAIFIVIGCVLMYICSYLNPDILIVNLDGSDLNLIDAMKVLFIAGIILYGCKDILKLKDILGVSTDIKEIEEDTPINEEVGVG